MSFQPFRRGRAPDIASELRLCLNLFRPNILTYPFANTSVDSPNTDPISNSTTIGAVRTPMPLCIFRNVSRVGCLNLYRLPSAVEVIHELTASMNCSSLPGNSNLNTVTPNSASSMLLVNDSTDESYHNKSENQWWARRKTFISVPHISVGWRVCR